jgi:hypothetical protein
MYYFIGAFMRLSQFEISRLGDNQVKVTGKCFVTDNLYTVVVSTSGISRYSEGYPVESSFPELGRADCAFLSTGISPYGFEKILTAYSNPPGEDDKYSEYEDYGDDIDDFI